MQAHSRKYDVFSLNWSAINCYLYECYSPNGSAHSSGHNCAELFLLFTLCSWYALRIHCAASCDATGCQYRHLARGH